MMRYLRYSIMPFQFYPVAMTGIALGGPWTYLAFAVGIPFQLFVDNALSEDRDEPETRYPWLLDTLLFLHLPLGIAALVLLAWQAAPGDWLGIGAALQHAFGGPILANHARHGLVDLAGLALACGFVLSTNTIVAHEFVHRTASRFFMLTGRWLLALTADAQFSISHVYAHHFLVGTRKDSATARRGESVYAFMVRSSIGQYTEALAVERKRLSKKGGLWSLQNRVLTGALMTVVVVVFFAAVAGGRGLFAWGIAAGFAKALFEAVNYIQHYGLVRVDGTPVRPHHSWDCLLKACTNLFYNLTRHADHHARASVPFWNLKPYPQVMQIRFGYMGAMIVALVPPVWRRLTQPLLEHWDREMASPDERKLAVQANHLSGIKGLLTADRSDTDETAALA
jgi:fatty acid desaturase